MQAKKKLSKPHIRQTKAQIIIFWAKRRTMSVLSGHFSSVRLNYLHANQLKQVQTKWRTVSEWYQKKYQCWYVFFFVQVPKKNEFHFFFDYRNMRAFNFETFFSTFNGCVCSPNDINRVGFFSSKSELWLVSNLATCVNCLVLHECKPT